MEFIIQNFGRIILSILGLGIAALAIKNFVKIKAFLTEVKIELGKVTWSTRQELMGATAVVVTITLIMALYIGVVDFSLSRFLTLLIR